MELDRLVAVVQDPLGDREHVGVVDLDPALEAQPLAVVPGERDRLAGAQLGAVGAPDRVAAGDRHRRVGGDPAELDEVGVERAGRAQQGDVGGARRGGQLVVRQDHVVDPATGQREGAADAAVVEIDPVGALDDLAGDARLGTGGARRTGRAGRDRIAARRGWRPLVDRLLGTGRLLPLRLLDPGQLVEILEGDDDRHRQNDRHDQVALLGHYGPVSSNPRDAALGPGPGSIDPRAARLQRGHGRRRHGIVAEAAPGVTSCDAAHGQPDAAQRPVARQRLEGIFGAGRQIAATRADPGRQDIAVQPDGQAKEPDQRPLDSPASGSRPAGCGWGRPARCP